MPDQPKHTAGPWSIEKGNTLELTAVVARHLPVAVVLEGGRRGNLTVDEVAANARRIVACVNALEGLTIELLEEIAGIDHPLARLAAIATVTDEIGQETLANIIEIRGDAAADAIIADANRAIDRIKAAQPREHLRDDVAQPHEPASPA
jgi:hypothetical protein